jgi:hypothetical protein
MALMMASSAIAQNSGIAGSYDRFMRQYTNQRPDTPYTPGTIISAEAIVSAGVETGQRDYLIVTLLGNKSQIKIRTRNCTITPPKGNRIVLFSDTANGSFLKDIGYSHHAFGFKNVVQATSYGRPVSDMFRVMKSSGQLCFFDVA